MKILLLIFLYIIETQQAFCQVQRKVLVEEMTGTWCGYCPGGITQLDSLSLNPNIIVIANHGPEVAYDPLANSYSASICGLDSAGTYPVAAIDRYDWNFYGYGAVVPRTTPCYWQAFCDQRLAIPAPVSIDLITSYDSISRIVTVTINAGFVDSASGNLRIGCTLIENKVVGPAQENYFGNGCNAADPSSPWYNYPCVIHSSSAGFNFNFVARTSIPANKPFGIPGSISSAVTAGQHFSVTNTDTLPRTWNSDNIKVVAYVTRFSNYTDENEILNAQEVDLGSSIIAAVQENPAAIDKISLDAVYPNPFTDVVHLNMNIPASQHVTVKVVDLLGREVATLVDQNLSPGVHELSWNGMNQEGALLPNGIYLIRLQTDNQSLTRSAVLARN